MRKDELKEKREELGREKRVNKVNEKWNQWKRIDDLRRDKSKIKKI